MILRRVMQHVREQNWTAIGIDFVIVVVGVFVGIQVSNWNDAQRDQARARGYLERFRDDLAVDVAALERREVFWGEVEAYGLAALDYAENGRLRDGSAWATLVAFYHATQIWPFEPYDATYREITGSGDLPLISDPDLRRALGDYVTGYQPQQVIFGLVPPYRFTVRGLVPWSTQEAIWAECFETVGLDDYAMLPCDAQTPEAEAQAVIDRLTAEPAVTTDLRNWMRNLRLIREFGQLDRAAALELDAKIAEALIR